MAYQLLAYRRPVCPLPARRLPASWMRMNSSATEQLPPLPATCKLSRVLSPNCRHAADSSSLLYLRLRGPAGLSSLPAADSPHCRPALNTILMQAAADRCEIGGVIDWPPESRAARPFANCPLQVAQVYRQMSASLACKRRWEEIAQSLKMRFATPSCCGHPPITRTN